GSGPQGRILEDDVRRVAQASAVAPAATISKPAPAPQAVRPAVPQAASSGARGGEERIPIHGLRKRIFEKMAKSNVTAAHFTYVEEVDMSQLVHLRDHLKEAAERKGLKLTFLPFFIKSILGALKEFPTLNASVDDERGEIVLKKYFHIGIATATDEGLTVTVVHDADKKDLWGLAKELERLSNAAREKRLALEDVLLVERDRLGGGCLNYGCIPSKALIHTANLVHAIERATERGVETGPVKVDMARLQQWKSAVVQRLSNGVGQLCKGNGVDVLAGHASFTGPDRATVRTPSGSEEIA